MATRTAVAQALAGGGTFDVAVSRDGSSRDRQEMVVTDSDGNLLDPGTTATPLAPQAIDTNWVEVLDLASARGHELQNDSDVDMFYCYGTSLPSGDKGLRLRKGASRFFAPPRDRSFIGKVYAKTESGSGKNLRKLSW